MWYASRPFVCSPLFKFIIFHCWGLIQKVDRRVLAKVGLRFIGFKQRKVSADLKVIQATSEKARLWIWLKKENLSARDTIPERMWSSEQAVNPLAQMIGFHINEECRFEVKSVERKAPNGAHSLQMTLETFWYLYMEHSTSSV